MSTEALQKQVNSYMDLFKKVHNRPPKNADELFTYLKVNYSEFMNLFDNAYDNDGIKGNSISGNRYLAQGNTALFQTEDGQFIKVDLNENSSNVSNITDKDARRLLDLYDDQIANDSIPEDYDIKLGKDDAIVTQKGETTDGDDGKFTLSGQDVTELIRKMQEGKKSPDAIIRQYLFDTFQAEDREDLLEMLTDKEYSNIGTLYLNNAREEVLNKIINTIKDRISPMLMSAQNGKTIPIDSLEFNVNSDEFGIDDFGDKLQKSYLNRPGFKGYIANVLGIDPRTLKMEHITIGEHGEVWVDMHKFEGPPTGIDRGSDSVVISPADLEELHHMLTDKSVDSLQKQMAITEDFLISLTGTGNIYDILATITGEIIYDMPQDDASKHAAYDQLLLDIIDTAVNAYTNGILKERYSSGDGLEFRYKEGTTIAVQLGPFRNSAPPPPPRSSDPIGFEANGWKFDFIEDENMNGIFDDVTEFIGEDYGWADLLKYDTNGDGVIEGDELNSIKILANNFSTGESKVVSASEAGVQKIDLSSYIKHNEIDKNGNLLAGTFNIIVNDKIIQGTQTYDTEEYIRKHYEDDYGLNMEA